MSKGKNEKSTGTQEICTKNCIDTTYNLQNKARKIYTAVLFVNCLCGLALSLYSYYVELHLEQDKNYKAYCDFGPTLSCTKAFGSEYGKGMGIFGKEWKTLHQPNSLYGIMFYSMIGTLVISNGKFSMTIAFVMVIISNFASLYFSYILYYVLYDMCFVCITIYLINVINLIFVQKKRKTLLLQWTQIDKEKNKKNEKKTN